MGRLMLKFPAQLERRIELIFTQIFRGLLAVTIVVNAITQNWVNLFITVLTLGLTYLPYVIAERNRVVLPPLFQMMILLFLFASMYLGEVRAYYLRFWWWDVILHISAGVILGIVGFFLIYFLNQSERVALALSPRFIAFFAFAFTVAAGAVWEIFEFAMDSIFGLGMQKSGLVDTMWDLIVDSLGALVTCLAGYFYVKKERRSLFKRFTRMIVRQKVSG